MTVAIANTRAARAAKQAARRAEKRDAALAAADVLCGCGCGAAVTRRYLPGHDARHKSALLLAWDTQAALTDEQLALLDGFGYDAARLQERREADAADAAARAAKDEAAKAKQRAAAAAKAERAKERAAKATAAAKAHDAKVKALDREQANAK